MAGYSTLNSSMVGPNQVFLTIRPAINTGTIATTAAAELLPQSIDTLPMKADMMGSVRVLRPDKTRAKEIHSTKAVTSECR